MTIRLELIFIILVLSNLLGVIHVGWMSLLLWFLVPVLLLTSIVKVISKRTMNKIRKQTGKQNPATGKYKVGKLIVTIKE